jgi:hypothetical protein
MSLRTLSLLKWAAVLITVLACLPASSLAQSAENQPLKPDLKGAVGLGLIGAELGFVVPALAGARDAWVFIVFPVAGAAGGAAAGYFLLEKDKKDADLAVAALVTGMALVVPAMVVTIAATAYEPDEDELAARSLGRAAVAAGPGLVRLSERGLLLAPPGVAVVSADERLTAEAPRGRSLRVSLFSGQF